MMEQEIISTIEWALAKWKNGELTKAQFLKWVALATREE
jgi:hypothetical protein